MSSNVPVATTDEPKDSSLALPTPSCPKCGTANARTISYGLQGPPSDDTYELGGCVVHEDMPAYRCRNPRCRKKFGSISA